MALTARSLTRAAILVLSIGVALLLAVVAKSHGDTCPAETDRIVATVDRLAPP